MKGNETMKHAKKLLAMLLAISVIFAMSITAFADASTGTITVTNAQKGETYAAYKVFNASYNTTTEKTSYSIPKTDTDVLAAAKIATDLFVVSEKENSKGEYAVSLAKDAKAEDVIAWVKNNSALFEKSDRKKASEKAAADGALDLKVGEYGYYYITTTNGTLVTIDTNTPEIEVLEKNVDPTVIKTVMEGDEYGETNDAQIGDTVKYKTSVTLYEGAKNVVVHDVMDEGLWLVDDSKIAVKVGSKALTAGSDYKLVYGNDGCTFEIKFMQSYLDKITEETVVDITYEVELGAESASLESQQNKAWATWGDNSKSEVDVTDTYTYKFDLLKYAAGDDSKKNLAGAVFSLMDNGVAVKLVKVSDAEYRVATNEEITAKKTVDQFTTVADENIVIKGVDNKEYKLKELQAPDGYNLLEEDTAVTPDNTNAIVAEIANSEGALLPTTGGIGTTIFYVFGLILIAGAAVVLVARRRADAE